jgi:serine phosphatase RsbU (regulator of sigma subunit)
LAVADCTGHGVPGAFMRMLGSMGINSFIFQENNFESNKILNALHHYIFQALRQDKSDSRDGMDIAIIVINPTIKTVEYSGAMNPLYYVQKDELVQIKADGKPIGGGQYGTERDFSKHYIDTSLPATLYLSTDGFQDQFGGKDKRKFMTGNFKRLLKQIHTKSLAEQKMVLDSTIDTWMQEGNESQIDDILVIGVQV